MFKHIIRMILPLVVLVLIAMYLTLSPMLSTHAAAPNAGVNHVVPDQSATSSQNENPYMRWRP